MNPRTNFRTGLNALSVILILLTVACQSDTEQQAEAKSDDGKAKEEKRETSGTDLQEGYSLLYASTEGLKHVDKAFLIKFENDRVQKTVTGVSDFSAELSGLLESWAEASSEVRLDLDPLPELEKRKLAAVQKDRLLSFAPIVGRTGANFQRTLLLSQSGALNQLRHLTEELAKADPNPERSKSMKTVSERLDAHYDEVVVLLNDLYFCHNDPEPSINEG